MREFESIKELIEKGTGKEKAYWVRMKYWDQYIASKKPIITAKEAEEIAGSIKTEKEYVDYVKYNAGYSALVDIMVFVHSQVMEYENAFLRALSVVRLRECLYDEEAHLNAVLSALNDSDTTAPKELGYIEPAVYEKLNKYITEKSEQRAKDTIRSLKLRAGKYSTQGSAVRLDLSAKGELKINYKALRKRICETYPQALGTTDAVKNWVKTMEAEDFVPTILADVMEGIDVDQSITEAPLYSGAVLNARKEAGDVIYPYEEERIVFPDLKEIEHTGDYNYNTNSIANRLDSYYRDEINKIRYAK